MQQKRYCVLLKKIWNHEPRKKMTKKYKVTITLTSTQKAEDENAAEVMAVDEADFGNADINVVEDDS